MKILVIGSGGREHALCWRLRQSPQVTQVWCAPGNGGISQDADCVPADVKDVPGLVKLAQSLEPDLTVVGPELPLVLGIVDEFQKAGLRILGPDKSAARLEGSKIFAKEFLARHNIPTAPLYGHHDSAGAAYSALCAVDWPVVIKADGLCAGKGVFVAPDPDQATAFIERLMEKRELGPGGERVLMEEALEGQELSYIVLTDGQTVMPMVPTRDHKRVFDGDRGPNTGGMGAFSTDDLLPPDLERRIRETIVDPTIGALATDGMPYRGFLYFGLMLTAQGPMVLEFNCRLGDPEAQAVVARMDFDLAAALAATADGELSSVQAHWKPGASACVVMAAPGYPGEVKTGTAITGLAGTTAQGAGWVFQGGTRREGFNYYTSSGRVLALTAAATSLHHALASAYSLADSIRFEGAHYRKDIGQSALKSTAAGSWPRG
jgi:phosphoribosylamine--glycine ligase